MAKAPYSDKPGKGMPMKPGMKGMKHGKNCPGKGCKGCS